MKDGRKGGRVVGDSHKSKSGGVKTLNVDTGEILLVEGGEAVINKKAVKKHKKLLSQINQSTGGVPIMENGGTIPNNYEGKTAEEVWNAWNEKQRYYFVYDHFSNEDGATRYGKELEKIGDVDLMLTWNYEDLPKILKYELRNHVAEGQYGDGGTIKTKGSVADKNGNTIRKGNKVKTRKGEIETVERINSNGNVETLENDYSWPAYTLELVTNKKEEGGLIEEEIIIVSDSCDSLFGDGIWLDILGS